MSQPPPPTSHPGPPDQATSGPRKPRRRVLAGASALVLTAVVAVTGYVLQSKDPEAPAATAESLVMTYLAALNDRDADVVHDMLCTAKTDYLTPELIADVLADWPRGPILAEFRVDDVEDAETNGRDVVAVTVTVVHGGTDDEPHQHSIFLEDEEGLKLCAGDLTFG